MSVFQQARRERGPSPWRAFTLIELIVVILVLGILAALGVVSYTQFTDRAHAARATADLRQVSTAALVQATLDGASGSFDREAFRAVLEEAFDAPVTNGVRASEERYLGSSDDVLRTPGDFAVGFDHGDGNVNEVGGTRAAVVLGGGDGYVYTQVVSLGAGQQLEPVVRYEVGVTPRELLGAEGEAPAPALAPSGVQVAAGDTSLTVTWDEAPGASAYTVAAKAPDGAPAGAWSVAGTTAVGTGLVNGTTYEVTVAAVYAGRSAQAAPVAAVPMADPSVSFAQTVFSRGGQVLAPTTAGLTGPVEYAVTGQLPAGVTFSAATGEFAGPAMWALQARQTLVAGSAAAVTADGSLYTWGYEGHLGDGTTVRRAVPGKVGGPLAGKDVVQVSGSVANQGVVTADGEAYVWGANQYGQLGNGSTVASAVPVRVGGALLGERVTSLEAVNGLGVALTSDGSVYTWGAGTSGSLGTGTNKYSYTPVKVGGELQGKRVVAISAGSYLVAALTEDGEVYTWGDNDRGQLGIGSTTNSSVPVRVQGLLAGKTVTSVSAGDKFVTALTSDGALYAWGGNDDGQLGDGKYARSLTPQKVEGRLSGERIAEVSAGYDHVLARAASGTVFAWGGNSFGQMGDGTDRGKTVPTPVSGLPAGDPVTALAADRQVSTAVTASGAVYSWGMNSQGVDGVAGSSSSSTPVLNPNFPGQQGFPFTVTVTATSGARSATTGPVTFTAQ